MYGARRSRSAGRVNMFVDESLSMVAGEPDILVWDETRGRCRVTWVLH